jgi:hypothetical protein
MVPDDTREIQYIIINSQSLFKTQKKLFESS